MRCAAALAASLLVLTVAPGAWASPSSKTTAAVSLGDSYISGEAGRWNGNSLTPIGDKDGADRACRPPGLACQVDKTRVYEPGTENGGCHRSDVAEIKSARLSVAERIDLSCSGGQTKNIFRASRGGVGQNGEPPQADKLRPVARAKNVKLVMLSIGGNDLGFADIVEACLTAYASRTGPCAPSQQRKLDSLKSKVIADVGKAIDEIRAVMSEAGYAIDDYRLIVQTYPSVVPRAAESRYPELSPERTTNGCPFYDQDLNWARDSAAPQIGGVVKAGASSRRVEILDLVDAFQGHEFCSKTAAQSTPFFRPTAADAEWGRFVAASALQQGELQELFHPNAYGQRALGTCVTRVFAAARRGTFACSGAAGIGPGELALRRLSSFSRRRARLQLRVNGRTRRIRGRRCITGPVRTTVTGRDRARARRAEFFVGRRRVARDPRRPLSRIVDRRRHLGPSHRHAVRVRVRMGDGRLARLRGVYRMCGDRRT
ncbi:MAG: GDSL-type esterase/lipase family protein [Actinomycetota bacterium]|nr:GDSL-type esterase/lipase family protein [Actinomycetota bacterium]